MSRTYKDASYKVKAARAGVKDKYPDCAVCSDKTVRVYKTSIYGIFYAHEVKQIEEFIAAAAEASYTTVTTSEVRGFLGERPKDFYDREYRPIQDETFAKTFDASRVLYSSPHPSMATVMFTTRGPVDNLNSHEVYSLEYGFEISSPHVASKSNLFTVVQVTSEIEREHIRWHSHQEEIAFWRKINGGRCSCCRETKTEPYSKTAVRAELIKKAKEFNSTYDVYE